VLNEGFVSLGGVVGLHVYASKSKTFKGMGMGVVCMRG
jgi:hypothetical protein